MRRIATSAVLAGATLLAGCSMAPAASDDATTGPSSSEAAEPSTTVVGELRIPWSAVVVDGSVLVSERGTARVLELTEAGELREAAVVAGVEPQGEGGLLGLATDGESVFAYSTAADGNRVQRFPLTGEPGSLGLGEPETLISGLPAGRIHHGGRVALGPDGMLYVTVGDAGVPEVAQDLDALGGKILRLTPDGEVPEDNPFPGSPVYSYGHRNVQGIAWSEDGRMFASELGQNTWDELNEIQPGGNYGWPVVEGDGGEGEGYIDPLQVWSTDTASPSGIAIVDETIYIANLRGERLRTVPVADPGEADELLAGEYGRLRDVLLGPDGRVWILTNSDGEGNADSEIVAIDPVG